MKKNCSFVIPCNGFQAFIIFEVDEKPYHNLHDIFEHTYLEYKDKLINKSFCVRVKRRGKTEFNSMDAMRYIGGGLNQSIDSASVKLKILILPFISRLIMII